jgi:alpha/beta superfamily hydrolase
MSEVYFAGPSGRIEGRYHQNENQSAPVALVLHPHPLHGGTMNNKVSYHLFKTFVRTGFTVLRINFPGVGKSEGSFTNGVSELNSASTALDWLQNNNPEASHFWIGGFSFGAWVAMHIATRRPEIEGFVMISPPADHYDFAFSIPCPSNGLVVAGEKDTIATVDKISALVDEWRQQKNYVIDYNIVADAEHFYVQQLDAMDQTCEEYINTNLAMRVIKPIRKKRRKRKKRDKKYDEVEGSWE